MCPGRYLASNSLFLATATILKLFEVVPVKDEKGIDMPITGDFEGTGIVYVNLSNSVLCMGYDRHDLLS